LDTLERLAGVIAARANASPDESYVASLYAGGREVIARKVGEEALETVIAACGGDREAMVKETADLWFHSLIMLAHEGLGPADVLAELERRFGRSGHAEKASRGGAEG